MAFYGATGGHYADVTGVARMQRGLARLALKAESFEVNSPLPTIIDRLNLFKPDILFGYTTSLKMLGAQQRLGKLAINPASIAVTGEMVTSADIDFLSESFGGIPVHSIYASTEHMLMGFSNPDHETMTLVDSNWIYELYGDHSVVTNLFNYTVPLIRYLMSDIPCPVGKDDGYPIIVKTLVGRCE
jgi:phenylacetate-coenzyme A ligase PaaK-like adenylate-forming protein